ncbi:MAG: hypothetical protein RL662_2286 [Bacteroidota bacterium]
MNIKTVLNPAYKELEEFVEQLPHSFDAKGEIIQDRRNKIKEIHFEDYYLNVKRYRKPILLNRIIYSFFRKPKAYKAYYNGLNMLEKEFNTPTPIAYVEQFEFGMLSSSFFVSTQLHSVKEIREYYFAKVTGNEAFLTAFAQYTAQLHDANILHLDYSPGNILIAEQNEQYIFSLVDINRMQFVEIDLKMGCENFCRLFEHDEVIVFIAHEYAKARSLDIHKCEELMLDFKHKFERKKERKKTLKAFFGKS